MNTERVNRLREKAKKTKTAAHQRVIKDGTIQFRLNAENMEKLLKISDEKKMGVGVLARMWVLERLNKELITTKETAGSKSLNKQLIQMQGQMDALRNLMQDLIAKPTSP